MTTGRLPNLLVVGVPKAGTGSLFAYLSQHPDICPADEKEVGYFNYYNPRRHSGEPPSLDEYRKHFAHCGDERYVFEATPTYSYGGQPVIDAVQRSLDAPKILISLRNPVDRLWSAYTFQRELGNITGLRTFEEYLAACERRRRDGSDLVPRDHLHGLYIGYYADYVPLWLDAFGADIKVLFDSQLFRNPAAVMRDVFGWLDLDDEVAEQMDVAARNKTQHPRSLRAARLAYSVKRSADRRNLLPPRVREQLRRAYSRVNAGQAPARMAPEVRQHVEDLYRESNAATARSLVAHGCTDLPDWLAAHVRPAAPATPGADSAEQLAHHGEA
jgi:hypothetical protein